MCPSTGSLGTMTSLPTEMANCSGRPGLSVLRSSYIHIHPQKRDKCTAVHPEMPLLELGLHMCVKAAAGVTSHL